MTLKRILLHNTIHSLRLHPKPTQFRSPVCSALSPCWNTLLCLIYHSANSINEQQRVSTPYQHLWKRKLCWPSLLGLLTVCGLWQWNLSLSLSLWTTAQRGAQSADCTGGPLSERRMCRVMKDKFPYPTMPGVGLMVHLQLPLEWDVLMVVLTQLLKYGFSWILWTLLRTHL